MFFIDLLVYIFVCVYNFVYCLCFCFTAREQSACQVRGWDFIEVQSAHAEATEPTHGREGHIGVCVIDSQLDL